MACPIDVNLALLLSLRSQSANDESDESLIYAGLKDNPEVLDFTA